MHGATKWLMSFATELNKQSENLIFCPSFSIERPYWMTTEVVTSSSAKRTKQRIISVLSNYVNVLRMYRKIPGDADVVVFHAEPSTILLPFLKHKLPEAQLIYYCYQPPREVYDLWPIIKKCYPLWLQLILQTLFPFYRCLDRYLVARAHKIIVWGDEYEKYVNKIYRNPSVFHLPASIDFDFFANHDVELQAEIASKYEQFDHVLLINASLTTKKRVDIFIRLIRDLKDQGINACGVVIGEGDLKEELEKQAIEHGVDDRIDLVGFVTQEALPCYYFFADILCYLEPRGAWSMSIIEAGAARLPVVVAPGGSMQTLVKDGETGMILPEGYSPEQLLSVVSGLLANTERAITMGERNYQHTKQFSLEEAAKQFHTILVSSPRHSHEIPGHKSDGRGFARDRIDR